jgi:hypothetical protein
MPCGRHHKKARISTPIAADCIDSSMFVLDICGR